MSTLEHRPLYADDLPTVAESEALIAMDAGTVLDVLWRNDALDLATMIGVVKP